MEQIIIYCERVVLDINVAFFLQYVDVHQNGMLI